MVRGAFPAGELVSSASSPHVLAQAIFTAGSALAHAVSQTPGVQMRMCSAVYCDASLPYDTLCLRRAGAASRPGSVHSRHICPEGICLVFYAPQHAYHARHCCWRGLPWLLPAGPRHLGGAGSQGPAGTGQQCRSLAHRQSQHTRLSPMRCGVR